MGDYRHRTSGEVKSQGEWRRHHANTSFPRVWTQATLDSLMLDPVFPTPKPDAGQYQTAVRDGVEQDALGNWVERWAVRDMFSDYMDVNGVTHTKAEQEAAYQAVLDETAAKSVRQQRDRLLAECDWIVIMHTEKGTNIPAAWEIYRQSLRDITAQAGFPHNVQWPAKPE
jgi:hypothetical protein